MKIVLLTNILTPYRKNFYDMLHYEFKKREVEFLVLLMATTEPGRNWRYEEFKADYTKLLPNKTIKLKNHFIHLNFGYGKILKDLKPDIVIASGSYIFPAVWTSIRLKKALGYELYFWSESHLQELRSYSKVTMTFRELIRKNIYSHFDGFWFAGKLSKELIIRYALPKSKYVFVPNLINESKFYEANSIRKNKNILIKKWNLSNKKFIFICPARLTQVKGIIQFLNLFIKTKYKNEVTIIIAGEGELREEIVEFSEKNEIDVRLLGNRSEAEIIELYALADSFLMPSVSDANPLSCIEAIWAGLPLLVSENVGNYPEVVIENENGYVFSYSDKKAVISIIEKMVESDRLWLDSARDKSITIAKEKYDTKIAVHKIIDLMIK